MKNETLRTLTMFISLIVTGLTLVQSDVLAQPGSGGRPQQTTQILSATGVELLPQTKREWQLDVSNHSRIKLCSSGNPPFAVLVTDRPFPIPLDLDSYDGVILGITALSNVEQPILCNVIEFLPSSGLYITAVNVGSEPARGNLKVWAQ